LFIKSTNKQRLGEKFRRFCFKEQEAYMLTNPIPGIRVLQMLFCNCSAIILVNYELLFILGLDFFWPGRSFAIRNTAQNKMMTANLILSGLAPKKFQFHIRDNPFFLCHPCSISETTSDPSLRSGWQTFYIPPVTFENIIFCFFLR